MSRAGPLTDADFNRDSPYNTYREPGLPPTPISTVTTTSLDAALHPADVPYKFYVLTDTNGEAHVRATTYAEHQRTSPTPRRKGLLGVSAVITGATRLAAVIGDPVRHSRSPAIHNAAYAAAGLDWVFVALEVAPRAGARRGAGHAGARDRRAQRDDAAQGRCRAGLRRAHRRRRRARSR